LIPWLGWFIAVFARPRVSKAEPVPKAASRPTVLRGVGCNPCAELTARERARCLVLGSLVNAFTNYRDVKGELGQKILRVTDVTHGLYDFYRFLHTPHHNSV
jgi:hypothetical protein